MGKQKTLDGGVKKQLTPTAEKTSNYGGGCKHNKQIRHVLTIGKAKLWAGGINDINGAVRGGMDFAVFICVGGPSIAKQLYSRDTELGVSAAKALPRLARYVGSGIPPRLLVIDWPDFGVPPVGSAWWEALYEDLRKTVTGNVAIFCMGGHGRTGTSISILAHLNGDSDGADGIGWVRDTYCDHAVESGVQIEYLKKLGIITTLDGYKQKFYNDDLPKVPVVDAKWSQKNVAEDAAECDLCHEAGAEYHEALMCFLCKDCLADDPTIAEELKYLAEKDAEDKKA